MSSDYLKNNFKKIICIIYERGGHVEARGQLSGVSSLLSPCGSWGFNSSSQTWQQVSSVEPSPKT